MLPPHRESAELNDPLELLDLPGGKSWDGRIAYLDRDGVLNRWKENYVNSPDEVEILLGSGKAITSLLSSPCATSACELLGHAAS